jgi:hypothetical protein
MAACASNDKKLIHAEARAISGTITLWNKSLSLNLIGNTRLMRSHISRLKENQLQRYTQKSKTSCPAEVGLSK